MTQHFHYTYIIHLKYAGSLIPRVSGSISLGMEWEGLSPHAALSDLTVYGMLFVNLIVFMGVMVSANLVLTRISKH